MQLTTQLAVEAARKLERAPESEADRDFVLYVTMDLKRTLDRRDVLNPLEVGNGEITAAHVRQGFVHLAKLVRPEFEANTKLSLILSGEVIGSEPTRFVNLWDIGLPNQVPEMMEILGAPPDKSQLYGHLDYLVEEEAQDILRVFPVQKADVDPPASGNRLYYVMLSHQPASVDLYRFHVYFRAYREPLNPKGFKLVSSMISVTGILNRIIQFWSVEVPESTTADDLRNIVKEAFESLPWRDEIFVPSEPVILAPSEWDVSVRPKGVKSPNSGKATEGVEVVRASSKTTPSLKATETTPN